MGRRQPVDSRQAQAPALWRRRKNEKAGRGRRARKQQMEKAKQEEREKGEEERKTEQVKMEKAKQEEREKGEEERKTEQVKMEKAKQEEREKGEDERRRERTRDRERRPRWPGARHGGNSGRRRRAERGGERGAPDVEIAGIYETSSEKMGKRDSERGQREWVAKAKPWRGDKWRKQEEGREKRVQKDGAVAPHIRDNAGKRRERKETGNDKKSVEKPRRTQRRTQKEPSEQRTCDSQNAVFVFSLLPSCGELRDIPLYRALYALRREERGAKSLFAGLQRRVFALFSWARAQVLSPWKSTPD
ncbi:hypothetical protein TGRUB_430790 [Toxoplasma gondii RUB]|uniref:Uncharacterized protein n=1 Tax=Toxoplasma gondii RUB TaxID=935652 RepID=A0A086M0K1_TOXGO|nr:hypothetical protein TGRUB_430790 [Toxoplasma gondii RUB]